MALLVDQMNFNPLLEAVPPSPTIALADRVRVLQQAGRNILALQTGDPDFDTPEPIREAAAEALKSGLTHYVGSQGLPELRVAIAETYGQQAWKPAEVLVTSGGIHAFYCAFASLLVPGDRVVLPEPSWPTHGNLIRLLGGQVVPVASASEDHFLPPLNDLLSAITPGTKAVLLNYPGNPSGALPTQAYVAAVAEHCAQTGTWLISDEVYNALVYTPTDFTTVSGLRGLHERVAVIQSFSKTYAMTGWRVGFLAGPSELVERAQQVLQYTATCTPPFVQHGALAALRHPGIPAEVAAMRVAYQHRRDAARATVNTVSGSKFLLNNPAGAFYFFADIRNTGLTSADFAERALNECDVAVVPGHAFGAAGEGFVRLTFACSQDVLTTAVQRLSAWSATL